MQTHQRIWQYLQEHRVASIVIGHISVAVIVGALFLGNQSNLFGAFARSACSHGDQVYGVESGDTLGDIAARYNTSWQRLASYNHIQDANLIYINETVCIPGHGNAPVSGGAPGTRGSANYFPYGQCTWYANQRFYQWHGFFVPWMSQADAWEWTARAYNFHWRVSGSPSPGAIVDLQPWVEGAYSLGHVAVVERVLDNGDVIASNMNWGAYYWEVTYVQFTPGPGVSFISY